MSFRIAATLLLLYCVVHNCYEVCLSESVCSQSAVMITEEEELRRMFKEIQIPFQKHCPEDRKNFLSYSYILHKFVQLLELDEFIPCFLSFLVFEPFAIQIFY